MKQWVAIGLLAGVAFQHPVAGDAYAQQPAKQQQANPSDETRNAELRAIRDALNRIGATQDAQGDESKAAEDKKRADGDLAAQQEMARWAQPMFWATLLSALFALGSVIALVLTFRAQQQLSRNQVRAIIETVGATLRYNGRLANGTQGSEITVTVYLRNAGQTAALAVSCDLRATYFPEGWVDKEPEVDGVISQPLQVTTTNSIAAHGRGVATGHFYPSRWAARLLGTPETKRRPIDAPSVPEQLSVSVTLSYFDIFEREHEIAVNFTVSHLMENGALQIMEGSRLGFTPEDEERRHKESD